MRGKRKLTSKTIEHISARLGVPTALAKKISAENGAPEHPSFAAMRELSLDSFELISEWYHYAIFELVALPDFEADSRWIAGRLSITPNEAGIALERLVRLGLIGRDRKGRWRQETPFLTTTANTFTAGAFRKMQKQVLEKAIRAMDEFPMELRDQTSITMAIDSRKLPEAKERIKKFRRSLYAYLKSGKLDSVYQLGVSLYPLTKTEITRSQK